MPKLHPGNSVLCPAQNVAPPPQERSTTVKYPWTNGEVATRDGVASRWITVCASCGVSTAFGSCSFSFVVDSVGDQSKPIYLGAVPNTYTAFDDKLGRSGWGINSKGKLFHAGAAKTEGSTAISSGDRVSVKVDFTKGSMSFAVHNDKTKKLVGESSLKNTKFDGVAWIVPAISLGAPGAQVTFDTITDTTSMDTFGSKFTTASSSTAASFNEVDVFGNLTMRLYRRMTENDHVKVGTTSLSRSDVKLRVVLYGANCTPTWGRSPVAGMFDVDPTPNELLAVYNEVARASVTDPETATKLSDIAGNPPDAASKVFSIAFPSPITLSLAAYSAVSLKRSTSMPSMRSSNAAVASPSSQPLGASSHTGSDAREKEKEKEIEELKRTVKGLADRLKALEDGHKKLETKVDHLPAAAAGGNAHVHTGRPTFSPSPEPKGGSNNASTTDTGPGSASRGHGSSHDMTGGGKSGKRAPSASSSRLTRRHSSRLMGGSSGRNAAGDSNANPAPGGVRRQSVARGAPARPTKRASVAANPVATSISTTNPLLAEAQRLRRMLHDLSVLGEKGSPTDDDLKKIQDLKKKIGEEKVSSSKTITALPSTNMASNVEEAKDDLTSLIVDLVASGDHLTGNLDLFQAIFRKIPLDLPAIIKDNDLATMAAYDGSIQFLREILDVPKLSIDVVELVQCALFNQTQRIPVTLVLLDAFDRLGIASVADEIQDAWQDFFEEIASHERALPREVRTGRIELIEKMLKTRSPSVNPMNEGSDGQTVFSRAAREGDIELMTTLLTHAPGGINVNYVSTIDKTTALIQAVYKNQVTVVRALATLPNVDKEHACDEGTPLSIAKTLRRHPDIIKALEG